MEKFLMNTSINDDSSSSETQVKKERPGQEQSDNGTRQKTQSLQRDQSETEENDISVA